MVVENNRKKQFIRKTLKDGTEIVIHAFPDGFAIGMSKSPDGTITLMKMEDGKIYKANITEK